jgi:hypothetical protein
MAALQAAPWQKVNVFLRKVETLLRKGPALLK